MLKCGDKTNHLWCACDYVVFRCSLMGWTLKTLRCVDTIGQHVVDWEWFIFLLILYTRCCCLLWTICMFQNLRCVTIWSDSCLWHYKIDFGLEITNYLNVSQKASLIGSLFSSVVWSSSQPAVKVLQVRTKQSHNEWWDQTGGVCALWYLFSINTICVNDGPNQFISIVFLIIKQQTCSVVWFMVDFCQTNQKGWMCSGNHF